MAETFALLPHQVGPADALSGILEPSRSGSKCAAVLIGDTGVGKTYVTAKVARDLNLPVFVVAPKSALEAWKRVLPKAGVQLAEAITYESLRGVKSKKLSHPYLERSVTTEARRNSEGSTTMVEIVNYYASAAFRAMVDRGVLVVLDECQKIKNMTAQFKAAHALVEEIRQRGDRSRAALVTATPFDKAEMIKHHLYILGVIARPELGRSHRGTFLMTGLRELVAQCTTIDAQRTYQIMGEMLHVNEEAVMDAISTNHLPNHSSGDLALRLYTEVLSSRYVVRISCPTRDLDAKIGTYRMEEKDAKLLSEGIEALARAANYNEETGEIAEGRVSWGGITIALKKIAQSKVPLLERLIRETLAKVPTSKIIVFMEYIECGVFFLSELVRDLKPLIFTGASTEKERKEIVAKFQTPSLEHRVMIANPTVAGVSIDLHDTAGGFPRFAFLVPTYKLIDTHQAVGRIAREGMKSRATARVVFGMTQNKTKITEVAILGALSRKSQVLRQYVQGAETRRYLGEYDTEVEF